MHDAVIVDAIRTPIGRRGGSLAEIHPVNLSAHVLTTLADRTGLDPATVEDMKKSQRHLGWEERQELERLRRDNKSLERQLEQSEAAVDVLGKAAALLEALAKSAEPQESSTPPPHRPGRPAWLNDPDTSRLPSIPPRNS